MTDFVGHDDNMRAFTAAFSSGRLHHGWILAGPRGLGKAGFARNAAKILVDPGGQYEDQIERGIHPDVITVERPLKDPPKEGEDIDPAAEKKRSIGVDQIRALQNRLVTRPGLSDKRAVIIDAADDMERNAANALLKSLEEPPAGTYFFLISHSSARLLPTIRSRCQSLRFEPLSDGDMEAVLRQAFPDMDTESLHMLARAGAGSPGQAMEYAGLEMDALEKDMLAIVQSGDPSNAIRAAMAAKLTTKAAQSKYEAFLRRAPQLIAQQAAQMNAQSVESALQAWEDANILAARAIGVSLEKQSVVLQMGTLLASLQTHKDR
ncbi:DNA polymerase III subunit delta' [Sphingorhabdus arenilitoris]|uniref:DNA polymerase III subunit delta n=1 Tax=Sphingorhabdus arenilitoris TaxID=1490041 RepID=A0ABV8RGM9_9SPHN